MGYFQQTPSLPLRRALLLAVVVATELPRAEGMRNGVGVTPVMGWLNWSDSTNRCTHLLAARSPLPLAAAAQLPLAD